MTQTALFDPKPLLELEEDTSTQTMRTFAKGYLQDAPHKVQELEAALNQADQAQVVKNAHDLKSSSAGVGLVGLARVAKQMEASARIGQLKPVEILLKRNQHLLEQSWHALANWLE